MLQKKHIVVAHMGNVIKYPPIITLVRLMLDCGYKVSLVGTNTDKLPEAILENPDFSPLEIALPTGMSLQIRLKRRFLINRMFRKKVCKLMENAEYLWTTTDLTVRCLGKTLLCFDNHIMQLMELEEKYPLFQGAKRLEFPIDKYARHACKVVVPEENRAYIEQAWWKLRNKPFVLPNKPYELNPGDLTEDIINALDTLKNENRKVIMYLGLFTTDRDLSRFAEAIDKMNDEYCMYIVGEIRDSEKDRFNELMNNYNCVKYLGYYPAPKHLAFLKYAHIGLLPYKNDDSSYFHTPLNGLYCAPNKIFEYAGYGVPMLGTDVLGLKNAFEKYNIGVCCSNLDPSSIVNDIKKIDSNYNLMQSNCNTFYESVDMIDNLKQILQ